MSESIYNLVPVEYAAPEKRHMHKSTHNPKQNVPGSTFGCHGTTRLPGAGTISKKSGALFGPPDPSFIKESSSLTRTQSEEMKKDIESFQSQYAIRNKAALPPKSDEPIMGIKSTKNFVVANAVEAILQVPKKVENKELNYSRKEDFGKVPEYLSKVKEEIRRENDLIERYVRKQLGEVEAAPEDIEEMSEQEKYELIDALKAKWDSVNAKYQRITHLVQLDTTGQVRRKETLEAELSALERDIERLERPGPLLIRK